MKRPLLYTLFIIILLLSLLVSPAAADKGVVLNFNEVDISTMVKFISDLTGRNFVLDDRVKGKISVFSPSKLTNEEAYNVFVSVLELKGFTVVQSGKVAKIVPVAGAKQSGFSLLPSGEALPVNESYVAQVTKLEYITAQEALAFLQPMVSKDAHISAFGPGNMLLIVDSSLNVRKLQGLLRMIDTDRTRDGVEIIYLKNASAEAIVTTIRQWLSGTDNRSGAPPGAGGNAASVMADQRLNALLVFGGENVKKSVRDMVARLDVPSPEASNKVNVYYLEHSDAVEVAKVLDSVIKGIAPPPAAGTTQASPFDSGKMTITPDKATNSLVIMASPNDYSSLLQVIKKLDRRTRQVFVQVLIAEVSLDNTREIGMQAGVLGGYVAKNFSVGGFYDPYNTFSNLLSSINDSSLLSGNSNMQMQSPANVATVLQALDKKGLVNVLSTPNILTSDNKEAEIFVGENVPFLGNTSLTSTGISQQSVERKEIGIKFKFTPQISEGNYIRLNIEQDIQALKDTITIGSNSTDRTTTKRSAKTSVTVKDQETVVIGGLIQDKEQEIVSKVPLLGDIPGLGWLFKTKSKIRQKTNLMILLTPHIVKDAKDLSEISQGQRAKFGDSAGEAKPVDVQKEITGK